MVAASMQLGDGNAGHGRVARQRNHGVAVAAEHESGDVLDGNIQLLGDESAEARRVENAGHADHAIAREAAELVSRLRHGVERVGDDDQDAIGRVLHHLAHHVAHDLEVGVEQVVAAHAGLARNAGGDDHDVGVGGVGVIVGAEHVGVALFDGHGLQQIETLALGHAFDDVDQYDVAQFLRRQPVRRGGAHVARTHYRYLFTHDASQCLK